MNQVILQMCHRLHASYTVSSEEFIPMCVLTDNITPRSQGSRAMQICPLERTSVSHFGPLVVF